MMTNISIALQGQVRKDLQVLMKHAGYQETSISSFLEFVSRYVTPFINGVVDADDTPRWKSFMTDDFSPVEYSWAWKSKPHIRFSFDPIGLHLDRSLDPSNRNASTECIKKMQTSLKSTDWRLFDRMEDVLLRNEITNGFEDLKSRSDQSSVMLAAESSLKGAEPVVKASLATARADVAGLNSLGCIAEAFQSLGDRHAPVSALEYLIRYSEQRETSSPIKIVLAAVDCVDVQLARTKIYFRTTETSFESVRSVLSMDGQLQSWSPRLITQLKDLWYTVLSLDADFPETQSLPSCDHETSGILYYASMTPAKSTPSTKAYIPVKHYGVNDLEIANSLVGWMERTGHASYARSFWDMLTEVCSHRRLDQSRGMQTYVSAGVKGGELDITSYISPEFYHPVKLRQLRG